MQHLPEPESEPISRDLASPFAAAMAERKADTLQMVASAVAQNRVTLAYQPVVQGGRPDCIAFHEGLLRVLDEGGRIIPAVDFIGVVETTELGRRLDCLALEIGLKTLAETPDLRLSLNLSARSIGYGRWTETLQRALAPDPTIAERLILEITETSAMLVPDLVESFMAENRARGIAFALDDFGAGYTSFRYLRDFCFDLVKIDGQFIRGIARDPDNQVLTEALLSICRHFDMFAVAESVETAEDAAYLQAMGMDCLQGFYYGAPVLHPPWLRLAKKAG